MNSTQSDMERFRPSESFNTAQPGRDPSSTKLKTPIYRIEIIRDNPTKENKMSFLPG